MGNYLDLLDLALALASVLVLVPVQDPRLQVV